MLKKPLRKDESYNEFVKDFYRKIEECDWNDIAETNKGLSGIFHRNRCETTFNFIKEYAKPGPVLDVGCGTGLILCSLPEGSVGVDINPRNLVLAKKYAPQAKLVEADAEELPFPDNSFDTVVCTEVIEHVVFPERLLEEMYRVLRPGGVLIGSTPANSWLWRLRFFYSSYFHHEPFHDEFTRDRLRQLLEKFSLQFLDRKVFRSCYFFAATKKESI